MKNPARTPKDSTATSPQGADSLILRKAGKERLSKSQQTFNRLIRNIESLRKDIEFETTALNEVVRIQATELSPVEEQIRETRKTSLRLLYIHHSHPKLARKASEAIARFLEDQLDQMRTEEGDLVDEDLRQMYERLSGMSVKDALELDAQLMRSAMEEDLLRAGVKVDLSGLRPDLAPEEAAAQFARIEEEIRGQIEEKEAAGAGAGKRKSTKETEKEQKLAEIRALDISKLYKQLAKLLHPDLEQDPVRRTEKEAAMKQLTLAYRDQDLHGLLQLELEWITREGTNVERLTDQKLAIYNEVLREQVSDLKEQLRNLPFHPRFSTIRHLIVPGLGISHFNPLVELSEMRKTLRHLEGIVAELQSPDFLPALRTIAKDIQKAQRELDLDLFSDPF